MLCLFSDAQLEELRAALIENTVSAGFLLDFEGFVKPATTLDPLLEVLGRREILAGVYIRFAGNPEIASRCLDAFAANSSIDAIGFFHTVVAATSLTTFLRTRNSIKLLMLHEVEFQTVDHAIAAAALAEAVVGCDSLHVVSLDLTIDAAYVQPLLQSLQEHTPLLHLILHGVKHASRYTCIAPAESSMVATFLQECTLENLKVNLHNLEFGTDNFGPIVRALIDGPVAVTTSCCNCTFDDGATALFESMVAPSSKLVKLGVDCSNQFAKPIRSVLTSVLRPDSSLLYFHLSDRDNKDTDHYEGRSAIAAVMEALSTNKRLDYLRLGTIRKDLSYSSLLNGIPELIGVKRLHCAGFDLDKFDKNDVIGALQQNDTVEQFDCDGVDFYSNVDDSEKLGFYAARNTVLECIRYDNGGVQWSEIELELKNDHERTFAAWVNGLVEDTANIPCHDREFWRNAVNDKMIVSWGSLPDELQGNETFVRSMERFPWYTKAGDIFDVLPNLRHERDIWENIMDACAEEVEFALEDFAPVAILADRELMVKACELDEYVLRHVDPTLETDRAFLELVLDANPLALAFLTHPAQRLFPDLVQQTLEPFSRHPDFGEWLASEILPELWQDRSFAEAWFRTGLPFFEFDDERNAGQPAAWKDDEEIFLLVAEHCSSSSFAKASPTLRGDKTFMMQVVSLDETLFLEATPDLKRDFELAVLAFAGSRDTATQFYVGHQERRMEMQRRIHEKLTAHDMFVNPILCAVSLITDTTTSDACALTLLKQGAETTLNYKSLIAEYVGVPTGRELRLLRHAAENLED